MPSRVYIPSQCKPREGARKHGHRDIQVKSQNRIWHGKFLLHLDYTPSSYKPIDALDYFIVCVALRIKGVEASLDSEQDLSPNSAISLEPHLPAGPTER